MTISGTGFAPFSPVSAVTLGGFPVLPSGAAAIGPDGSFSATVLVPALQPGAYILNVSAGGDSSGARFAVLGEADTPAPTPAPATGAGPVSSGPVAAKLAPLGSKLDWVAHFDNSTKGWSLYDPSGTFDPADLGPRGPSDISQMDILTDLISGEIYVFRVNEEVEVELGGVVRWFSAGSHQIIW